MKSRYLDGYEVNSLRGSLPRYMWLPLAVAAETGLRVGDVVSLRRADFDSTGFDFVAAKTGKRGHAFLSPQLMIELREEWMRRESEWCFPSPYKEGRHLTRQAVWSRVKRACEKSGVRPAGASPHSLRKVYAVKECKRHGIEATKEALQHDRISTTEIYALADWTSGECADMPLTRGDIVRIAGIVADLIGGKRE